MTMAVISGVYNTRNACYFCYFQKENYKVLRFHVNSSSLFEISVSLF